MMPIVLGMIHSVPDELLPYASMLNDSTCPTIPAPPQLPTVATHRICEFLNFFVRALSSYYGPSGVRILLDSVELIQGFDPGFAKVRGNGLTLCFKQTSPAEVDRLYAALTEAGHASIKAPWDAFWGQRYACVQDPDGNQIDLFADA